MELNVPQIRPDADLTRVRLGCRRRVVRLPDLPSPRARHAGRSLLARAVGSDLAGRVQQPIPSAGVLPETTQLRRYDPRSLMHQRSSIRPAEQDASAEVMAVLATAPAGEAPGLARTLVEESLAACVNLLPGARSVYRWQGSVCEDTETVMIIKTSRARFYELRTRFSELHSYDVPELLALSVADGLDAYMGWIKEQV